MSEAWLADPRLRRAALFALALAALFLVGMALRSVLLAVGLSLFLAYLASPAVDALERRGLPRTLMTLLVLAGAFGLLSGLVLALLPVLQRELSDLVEQLPEWMARAQREWVPWLEARTGLKLPSSSQEAFAELVARAQGLESARPFTAVAARAFQSTASFALALFQLSLVPVLAFYAIRDAPELRRGLVELIPAEIRGSVLEAGRRVNDVVSAYLRGQLAVGAILGVFYAIGWSLAGVPSGIFVGLLAGLLALIPYAGPAMGLGLALLLTLLAHGPGAEVLWVAGVFAVVQGLEGTVITPRIVGDSLGLHPIAVILGLVGGGELLGLVGMMLALPALAAAKVLLWPDLSGPDPSAEEAASGGPAD